MLRLKRFELERPSTVEEAVSILAGEETMACAGGTDLVPKIKRGQFEPRVLVSLEGIGGLDFVEESDGRLTIGALVPLAALERNASVARLRALHEAVASVATPIIRERATIGGNLVQDTRCRYYDRGDFWREAIGYCLKKDGDECRVAPGGGRCFATLCSDPAAALIALDAEVTLTGKTERTIPLESLYLGSDTLPIEAVPVDECHGVRVAHRDERELPARGSYPDRLARLGEYVVRAQDRLAHVDRDPAVFEHAGADDARQCIHVELAAVGDPLIDEMARNTTDPVAAHLGLGSVLVDDPHTKIGPV